MLSELLVLRNRIRQAEAGGHRDTLLHRAYNHMLLARNGNGGCGAAQISGGGPKPKLATPATISILMLQTKAVKHDVVGAASGDDPVPGSPSRRGRAVCSDCSVRARLRSSERSKGIIIHRGVACRANDCQCERYIKSIVISLLCAVVVDRDQNIDIITDYM